MPLKEKTEAFQPSRCNVRSYIQVSMGVVEGGRRCNVHEGAKGNLRSHHRDGTDGEVVEFDRTVSVLVEQQTHLSVHRVDALPTRKRVPGVDRCVFVNIACKRKCAVERLGTSAAQEKNPQASPLLAAFVCIRTGETRGRWQIQCLQSRHCLQMVVGLGVEQKRTL
jgi:hypothetical protein